MQNDIMLQVDQPPSKKKNSKLVLELKKVVKYRALVLMALPGLLYLFINNYLPMFGVVIAFKDYNFMKGITGSDWVGFKNFEYLFKTKDAYIITRNTILYNGAFIILTTIMGIGTAIILNEIRKRFLTKVYQTLILLPYLISMVIVSYLGLAFLDVENGFINKSILPFLGLDTISWYSEPKYWPWILTFVHLWKSIGNSCIIYYAAIIGIDHEYYEAAKIDGATKWHQIRSITIPAIMPYVSIMTLLAVGRIFYSDFGLFYQVPLNQGALTTVTSTIDTYVFRALMNLGDIGMSSAAGLYQAVVGFILVLLSNAIVSRRNKENALF